MKPTRDLPPRGPLASRDHDLTTRAHSAPLTGQGDTVSGAVSEPADDPFTDLITVKEAAKLLRLSPSTLNQYRCDGRGPVYRKHGGRVFYSRRSLMRWSERHRYTSTSSRIGPRP